jgi:CheY-like chemotaxis protein
MRSTFSRLRRNLSPLLVTALPNGADQARALNDGVVCYLRKPVDDEHLAQCVRKAFRSTGSH